MGDLLHEIRRALRVHLQRPWMALAAVVTLGLGIGLTAGMFSKRRLRVRMSIHVLRRPKVASSDALAITAV